MITFPTSFFSPRQQRLALVGRVVSSPASLSGSIQTVNTSGGGLWVVEFSGINLNRREKLKAFRALEGAMDGGATEIIVPICDCRQGPAGSGVVGEITYSDATLHTDGTGFRQGAGSFTAQAAALRATTLLIDDTASLEGGEHFGIDMPTKGRRMHRVIGVDSDAGSITIRPPLREAIPSGTALDFNTPSCTMRLANPDGSAPEVEMGRFAEGSLTFIESL